MNIIFIFPEEWKEVKFHFLLMMQYPSSIDKCYVTLTLCDINLTLMLDMSFAIEDCCVPFSLRGTMSLFSWWVLCPFPLDKYYIPFPFIHITCYISIGVSWYNSTMAPLIFLIVGVDFLSMFFSFLFVWVNIRALYRRDILLYRYFGYSIHIISFILVTIKYFKRNNFA